MSDIVERLRDRHICPCEFADHGNAILEAADRIEQLEARNKVLTGHLVVLLSDTWPYLHQWCTIKSIIARWKEARATLGEDRT
jgi:hypothetical protein